MGGEVTATAFCTFILHRYRVPALSGTLVCFYKIAGKMALPLYQGIKPITMNKKQDPAKQPQPFESDTEKLVHRHLSDPNHVITDEELARVRIGMTPPPDAPTQEAVSNAQDHIADQKAIDEDETVPGAQKSTPWDVIE